MRPFHLATVLSSRPIRGAFQDWRPSSEPVKGVMFSTRLRIRLGVASKKRHGQLIRDVANHLAGDCHALRPRHGCDVPLDDRVELRVDVAAVVVPGEVPLGNPSFLAVVRDEALEARWLAQHLEGGKRGLLLAIRRPLRRDYLRLNRGPELLPVIHDRNSVLTCRSRWADARVSNASGWPAASRSKPSAPRVYPTPWSSCRARCGS